MTEPESSLMSVSRTALDIFNTEYPALTEHVPGLVTEGFGLMAGPPKIGKSWMTLDIALGCSEGDIVLGGIKVDKRPVFLMALEDGERRLKARMRQLGRTPTANLHIATKVEPLLILATITEFLTHNPTGLVIVDTFALARREPARGENPYLADYKAGRDFKAVTDAFPGSALLAVHHTRKQGAADWMDTVSGSQGVNGSADFTLALTRERQSDTGTLNVTGRDIAEGEYSVTVTDCRWSLDGVDLHAAAEAARRRASEAREQKSSKLGDRMLKALAFVQSRPDMDTKPKDLASYLDVGPAIASNVLTRLVDGDHITKSGYGTYRPIQSGGETGEVVNSDEMPSSEPQSNGVSTSPPSGEVVKFTNPENHHLPASTPTSPTSPPSPASMPTKGADDQGSNPNSRDDAPLLPCTLEGVQDGLKPPREQSADECSLGRSLDMQGAPSPASMPARQFHKPVRSRRRTIAGKPVSSYPVCTVCAEPVVAGQGDTHLSCSKQQAAS